MSIRVTAISSRNNVAHHVRVMSEGAQVFGPEACTPVPSVPYAYYFDLGAGVSAAGQYQFAIYQTSNNRLRAAGEFYFDGADIVYTGANELDAAAVQASATAALVAYDPPTNAELTATQAAVIAAITALPSVAQIEAALLNDGDGQALLAAISASMEAAINDDTDGSPTLAGIQAVVAAALAAYGAATVGNVTSSAGLTPAQQTMLTFIRDVSEADESYTPGTAQKLIKGTATVLVDKVVTSNTECTVNTTLIGAP